MNDAAISAPVPTGRQVPNKRAPDPYAVRRIGTGRWAAILAVALAGGILSGFRWLGYGRDYYDYLLAYATVQPAFSLAYTRFEPGYATYIWFGKYYLSLEYEQLATILVVVSLTIKQYLLHKYTRYGFIATFVYLLMLYPSHEYTQIRVAVGVAFGFWAIHLFLARRWYVAVLCLAIAVSFHYTMILLPMALVPALLVPNRNWVFAAVAVTVLSIPFSRPILDYVTSIAGWFNPLADVYTMNVERGLLLESVNIFSVYNICIYLSLASVLLLSWFDVDRYRRIFISLGLLSVFVMFLFVSIPIFAHRLREILVFALFLYAFRDPRSEVEFVPGGFLLLAGLVTFYGAILDEVIIL